MATHGVEAVTTGFARTNEEHLGRAIGLAAIVASLPGVAEMPVDRVRELIDHIMQEFIGAKSDTREAARRMAAIVISAAKLG